MVRGVDQQEHESLFGKAGNPKHIIKYYFNHLLYGENNACNT
jgi:hypothetical protein